MGFAVMIINTPKEIITLKSTVTSTIAIEIQYTLCTFYIRITFHGTFYCTATTLASVKVFVALSIRLWLLLKSLRYGCI